MPFLLRKGALSLKNGDPVAEGSAMFWAQFAYIRSRLVERGNTLEFFCNCP